jgi:hypothetical protein
MDTLNDHYPLYNQHPDNEGLSDQDLQENREYANRLRSHHERKRKKPAIYSDWLVINNEDLWYLWCIISEHQNVNNSHLLDTMDYNQFCRMCYENSSR